MVTNRLHKIFKRAVSKGRRLYLLLVGFAFWLNGSAQVNVPQVLQMGCAAMQYDDYVSAIHYFNIVLEAKPYLADAYYFRAYAKFSLEDYDSAESDLNEAIKFNPFKVQYYQLRGLTRIHTIKYEGAIADYTQYLSSFPDDQGANYNRVLCRLENKDYDTANQELDHILKRWPKFTRAYLVKSQVALELKDTTQALFWTDSLLAISKREPNAWGFKGRLSLIKERYEQADSFYTQALKYDVGNVDFYLDRAQARHALYQYGQALSDYDRVIEMIPQHFVAHYNRALIRALVGDDNRAIEDFDFILAEEPNNILAIYNRAELRKNVGDYYGAIADYTTIIRSYPNFLYGYQSRAECYRAVGQNAKASKDETHLRQADLDLIYGNGKRRDIKKVRKRSEHGLEHYDQLVEEDADTARTFMGEFSGKVQNRKVERVFLPVYHVEGNHLLVDGARQPIFSTDEKLIACLEETSKLLLANQTEKALENVKDVIANGDDKEPVLYYNLGCLEAEVGSLEDAGIAFDKAYELDPQMAEAVYNRAVVYLLLSENDKAIPLLSKAGEMGLFKAYNLLKQAKKEKAQ